MEINPWTEVTTFHFLSDRRAAFGKANQTHAMTRSLIMIIIGQNISTFKHSGC
jgi:hypothetical protein